MFAKISHQLQFFSLLLILLATLEFKPFIEFFSYSQTLILVTSLVSFSFLISLGERTRLNSYILAFCLLITFLLTANNIYLYPTLGVLVLCVFTIGLFHFIDQKSNPITNLNVSWQNVFISFLLLIIPALLISKNFIENRSLFNLALLFSALSVIHLSFKNLKKFSTLRFYYVSSFGSLGLTLFHTNHSTLLEQLSIFTISLSVLHFVYSTFSSKKLNSNESYYDNLFSKPEPIIIGYFLFIAMIGAFLLQTPFAQSGSLEKHSLLDSFFTALSAVCVTGLIIFDTPVDFSHFGQIVIITLIQLGGLGITTLSAWILLMLSSGRLSFSHEETIKSMSGHFSKIDIKSFLKKIILYFLVIESIGAFLLFLSFLNYEPWTKALWQGVFTSISAFCNAGFALKSDSLIPYQNSPIILLIVSMLIIAGGFAPLLALDIFKKIKKPNFNLQEKVVLVTTVTLLLSGFVFLILVEWSQSLGHLQPISKIANAWLQSASVRTAGFNSVDLSETRSVTQLFIILLMFIGGNPGSTAGGIKTVTIAVLAITAISALKDNDEIIAFGRKIPHRTIYRASLIVFFSFGIHFLVFFFLSMTQNIEPISLMFETFSALGTVGASVGATSQLDEIGKIIIIISMLVGRVGPLTFVLLLMKKSSKQRWKTPEEDVFIT